jgi:hypothetical protein
MTSTRSELVVPIRDRRQHRRILTLKNFRNAIFVIIAIFAGITIVANVRKPKKTTDDYGRLYAPRVQSTSGVSKKPEIIQEGQINDATAADPTLIRAQARAQILTGESDPSEQPLVPTPAQAQPAAAPAGLVGHDAAGRLVVVGGPEGVTLVQKPGTKPVLGGGFGRH